MAHPQKQMILDLTLRRIEIFNAANGGGVIVRKVGQGYSLFREDNGFPVARLKPQKATGLMEVLWWSQRGRWDRLGDSDGLKLPLEEALEYIAEDPMDCFWF